MMKKFEAPTLEEAYAQAAKELDCSITNLETTVIQIPSRGILGMFKKSAIITAVCKSENCFVETTQTTQKNDSSQSFQKKKPFKKDKPFEKKNEQKKENKKQTKVVEKSDSEKDIVNQSYNHSTPKLKDDMFQDFHNSEMSNDEFLDICKDIKTEIDSLFKNLCFEIEPVSVTKYNDNTVEIKFDGQDAALLIGKDGYRYKALSYFLFNWINARYNLLLRLEIAEFLSNQEDMIKNYLTPLKENIDKFGKGQTKILDGVLVQIALKELRSCFPNKYVAIKTASNGGKYIVVNDFIKKNGR